MAVRYLIFGAILVSLVFLIVQQMDEVYESVGTQLDYDRCVALEIRAYQDQEVDYVEMAEDEADGEEPAPNTMFVPEEEREDIAIFCANKTGYQPVAR